MNCSCLEVNQIVNTDKGCLSTYNMRDTIRCSGRPDHPICAVLDGEYVYGRNQCMFCISYGNTNAVVSAIGTGEKDIPCGNTKPPYN